jgi:pimeloyl-ACP methyl ester carboxylesterase
MPVSDHRRSRARSGGDLGELAAMRQFPRLAMHAPRLLTVRRGRGEPVLVLPGYTANDVSTSALRGYLTSIGYHAVGWGLGTNNGRIDDAMPRIAGVLKALVDRRGRPATVVGQSLGGYLARELAREHPDLVAQVITFGTPMLRPRSRKPILCPVTVMYSKADRIVPWKSSVDHDPRATNIEVTSTHLGMGFDPDVWRIIARQLASSRAAVAGVPRTAARPERSA